MLGSCGGVSVALAAIPVLPQHPRCGVEARLHVQLHATPGSAWSEEGWEARQTPLVPPSRRSISYEADCHQYSGGICRPLPPAGWLYLGEACAGAAAVQLYTAFGYAGPGAARAVKDELAALLRAEGTTWRAVVRDAVARTSWREPVPEPVPEPEPVKPGEASVQMLVQEAEELKRLLDSLGERMEKENAEAAVVAAPPTEM